MKLYRHVTANEEQLLPFPFSRELSMESYLVENQGVLALDDQTFSEVAIIQEELTLKQGRSTKDTDGRIDLLITYSSEYIGVVELKLGELKEIHLQQLEDYLIEKDQILKLYPDIIPKDVSPEPKWVGVLVGNSICPDLANKISSGYITETNVSIAALAIKRYKSKKNGGIFITSDIYFKNTSSHKDFSKYVFQGKALGKGRLVLAIIKKYVEDNSQITFAELQKAFPDNLQGSVGVITTKELAEEILSVTARSRHFVKPNELIKLNDSIVAVCSQWGSGNIDKFITRSQELGYEIQRQ